MKKVDISVVIPIYKEAVNIKPFLDRLEPVLQALNVSSEIIFALDPSPDNSEEIVSREIELT